MIQAQVDFQINRPVEECFDYWADVRNENAWNPGSEEWEKTSPGPVGAGATFKGRVRGMGRMTVQTLEYQRPRRVVHRGSAASIDFTSTLTFEPSAGGTRVHGTGQVEPRGLFRLMTPLMRPLMQRRFAATMANLKHALEEHAAQLDRDSATPQHTVVH